MPNVGFSCLFILAVLTLSGCAAPEVQDKLAEPRSSIQSISVGVGDFAPGGTASAPRKSAAAGAIGGAAGTELAFLLTNPICLTPYGGPVCAVFMPILALMGAAQGSADNTYRESKSQAQQEVSHILSEDAAQKSFVSRVVDYGSTATNRNFEQITKETADNHHSDALLEVAVLKIEAVEVKGGFWEFSTTHFALNMEARARLKRVSDGAVLAEWNYRYLAAPRTPQEWTDNGGKPLLVMIDDGFRQLAEWVVDDFFLGQYADTQPIFPMPEAPPVSGCAGSQHCTKRGLLAVPVDGLRPTLRWSFNAVGQKHSSVEAKETLPKVSYEVRVFSAKEFRTQYAHGFDLWPTNIVYFRSGLTDTLHTLEDDLAPCSYYMWTVRAVMDEDGKKRVTEWSGNYHKGVPPIYLRQSRSNVEAFSRGGPFHYAYPFSTPCEGKPMEQMVEIKNKMMGAPPPSPEMQKLTSGQTSSGSSSPIHSITKPSTQEVIPASSIGGTLLGKEIKTTGLAGLVGGIDIKLLLSNNAEKDIAKISGKVKLSDDSGNEIGSVSFHVDKRIPSYGNIEITQTVYPIVFFGYTKLKDTSQEKIKAVFTFESIEFSDGTKGKN